MTFAMLSAPHGRQRLMRLLVALAFDAVKEAICRWSLVAFLRCTLSPMQPVQLA